MPPGTLDLSWLDALPKIAGIIERGGIIGVLLIALVVVSMIALKFRKELIARYRDLDLNRAIRFRYKAELDRRQVVVDISDIIAELQERKEP